FSHRVQSVHFVFNDQDERLSLRTLRPFSEWLRGASRRRVTTDRHRERIWRRGAATVRGFFPKRHIPSSRPETGAFETGLSCKNPAPKQSWTRGAGPFTRSEGPLGQRFRSGRQSGSRRLTESAREARRGERGRRGAAGR